MFPMWLLNCIHTTFLMLRISLLSQQTTATVGKQNGRFCLIYV